MQFTLLVRRAVTKAPSDSKGRFLGVRMRNGSNFSSLNLFLEQGDVIEQHWAPANVYTAEFQLLSY